MKYELKDKSINDYFDTILRVLDVDGKLVYSGLLLETRGLKKAAGLLGVFSLKKNKFNEADILKRWKAVEAQTESIVEDVKKLRVRQKALAHERIRLISEFWEEINTKVSDGSYLDASWTKIYKTAESVINKLLSGIQDDLKAIREEKLEVLREEVFRTVWRHGYFSPKKDTNPPSKQKEREAMKAFFSLGVKAMFHQYAKQNLTWHESSKSLWWLLDGLEADEKTKRFIFEECFGINYSQSLKGGKNDNDGPKVQEIKEIIAEKRKDLFL
jgi:hypothetical protein